MKKILLCLAVVILCMAAAAVAEGVDFPLTEVLFSRESSAPDFLAQVYSLTDAHTLDVFTEILRLAEPIEALPEDMGYSDMRYACAFTTEGGATHTGTFYYSNWRYEETYLVLSGSNYSLPLTVGEYLWALEGTLGDGKDTLAVNPAHAGKLAESGWVADALREQFTVQLPQSLVPTVEDEATIFWGYVDHLSQTEGVSLAAYAGQEISLFLYAVHPDDWQRRGDVELQFAAILQQNDTIIGAYLTETLTDKTPCWTLAGIPYETLTVQAPADWLVEASALTPQEQALAGMSAEEVLRVYLDACVDQDTVTMLACSSKRSILSSLSYTWYNDKLYETMREKYMQNEMGGFPLEIVSVEPEPYQDTSGSGTPAEAFHVRRRWAENNFDPPQGLVTGGYVILRYESDITGWRVDEFASGL